MSKTIEKDFYASFELELSYGIVGLDSQYNPISSLPFVFSFSRRLTTSK